MMQSCKVGNLSHPENHSKHPNPSKSMGNLSSNLVYHFQSTLFKNILILISFNVGRGGVHMNAGAPGGQRCWEPLAMSARKCTWVICQSSTRS